MIAITRLVPELEYGKIFLLSAFANFPMPCRKPDIPKTYQAHLQQGKPSKGVHGCCSELQMLFGWLN